MSATFYNSRNNDVKKNNKAFLVAVTHHSIQICVILPGIYYFVICHDPVLLVYIFIDHRSP